MKKTSRLAYGLVEILRRQGRGIVLAQGSRWRFDFEDLLRIWDADLLDIGVRVGFRKTVTKRGRRHALEVHRIG